MDTAAFATLSLNDRTVEIQRGTVADTAGTVLTLRPQTAEVLKVLSARRGNLVTKDELVKAVWGGLAVTDDSLVQCITEIRKALGDDKHEIVKTVVKRGYVLVVATEPRLARATRWRWPLAVAVLGSIVVVLAAAYFWPAQEQISNSRQSVAVLPFDDMSSAKDAAYLGDGIAEDIITMLARSPDLEVSARNSSFAFKGTPLDIRKIGGELGVDYVLEGSVRKEANNLRIVAQLNDVASGSHVWAERFDKSGADPWALQDEITSKVVASLAGEAGTIRQVEYRRAWAKETASLEEYDYYLRAQDFLVRFGKENYARAEAVLREGLRKFPESGWLKTKLAFYHFFWAFNFWGSDPESDYRQAGVLVREALAKDEISPRLGRLAHWIMAYVLTKEGDFRGAVQHAEKSLAISPHDPGLALDLSTIFIMSGDLDRAMAMVDKAVAASPSLDGNYRRAWIYHLTGEDEESLAALDKAFTFPDTPFLRAIGLARLGRLEDAQAEVKAALEKQPGFTQSIWREGYFYSDPSIVEREVADLARAGVPEK
jgi:adenylate cyclase